VCGLNPHAGEQGHLGKEELEVIIPALDSFPRVHPELATHCHVSGPYPADTLFSRHNLSNTDLFLGMYHDQVLPVIKYASFGACANVTLGLPYLRTSVDHGTGLDIADQFIADSGSMEYAIQFAINGAIARQQSLITQQKSDL
jgi:4-hydroxythreonine-4-phosphate dehydrogenase